MKNKENCCKKESNKHLLRRFKSRQNCLNYLTDVSRQKDAVKKHKSISVYITNVFEINELCCKICGQWICGKGFLH